MGVYISGMEMPKSCAFCRFNGAYCYAKGDEDAHSTLPCPLVSVPEHGRLIDADAMIVELMNRGVEGLQTDDWHEIQQAVADAPAIIEADEPDMDSFCRFGCVKERK